MNIAELLNYMYQVILPYASMVDVQLTDISIKGVIAIMYVMVLVIGFLCGVYNVPAIVRELPDDTKTVPALVVVLCIGYIVIYTLGGILIGLYYTVSLLGQLLVKYTAIKKPISRSDGL